MGARGGAREEGVQWDGWTAGSLMPSVRSAGRRVCTDSSKEVGTGPARRKERKSSAWWVSGGRWERGDALEVREVGEGGYEGFEICQAIGGELQLEEACEGAAEGDGGENFGRGQWDGGVMGEVRDVAEAGLECNGAQSKSMQSLQSSGCLGSLRKPSNMASIWRSVGRPSSSANGEWIKHSRTAGAMRGDRKNSKRCEVRRRYLFVWKPWRAKAGGAGYVDILENSRGWASWRKHVQLWRDYLRRRSDAATPIPFEAMSSSTHHLDDVVLHGKGGKEMTLGRKKEALTTTGNSPIVYDRLRRDLVYAVDFVTPSINFTRSMNYDVFLFGLGSPCFSLGHARN
ncbi:hypothetical protein B0H14DRAFT_3175925 [Mycena olivaceomarginata]|nr:hypothetical protein B0H14DRAFT_3175925 [Mycena olivaceomarginata]